MSLNAFIVNKITFANFLGECCEGMNNVDVHRITDTIGIDKRISPYFFGYGAPFGGTCFPRDTSAFIKFASDRGKQAKHLEFANEVNEDVYQSILKRCENYDRVGIVGVSCIFASEMVFVESPERFTEVFSNLTILTSSLCSNF